MISLEERLGQRNHSCDAHQESTQCPWETAGEPGTLEETTTSAVDGQLETVSGVDQSRITVCENPRAFTPGSMLTSLKLS